MGAASIGTFDLVGTKGSIHLNPSFGYGNDTHREIKLGEKTQKKTFPMKDQFAAEIEYFSDCVLNDKVIEPNGSEGEVDVAIIEAIYKSARVGKPIKVNVHKEGSTPKLRQKIARPPHGKIKTVNAPSPSVN